MPDEYLSRAEFAAWREALERRVDGKVSADTWALSNTHLQQQITEGRTLVREQLAELDRDCRERTDNAVKASTDAVKRIEDRGQITWGRVLAVAGIVVTLLVGYWTVSKGAH